MRHSAPSLPGAYAAIDLGTNNCRMLLAVPTRAGFRVIDSFSRIVRLGEGLHDTGVLSPQAMDRAIDALKACLSRLTRRRVLRLRAVATEACRRAGNGRAFIERVREETGLVFDIIAPREEAALALESCAPLLAGEGRRALLFDIGGGSTELAWVRLDAPGGPELIGYDSLDLGVVTMAERYGAACFTPAGFQAMTEEARTRLMAFERVHRIGHEVLMGGVRALGTSGTATTLAGVALNLARYRRPLVDGVTLLAEDADQAMATLRRLTPDELAAHPCVGPDRVPYVLPGCAIFAAIQQVWAMPNLTVADRGLREGLLLRLIRGDAPVHGGAPQTRAPTPGLGRAVAPERALAPIAVPA